MCFIFSTDLKFKMTTTEDIMQNWVKHFLAVLDKVTIIYYILQTFACPDCYTDM